MSSNTLKIRVLKTYPVFLSVCTIVSNADEYQLMQESFANCGFAEGCEFLMADNVGKNNFDAYSAINRFLQEAKGQYIMIVHQDVRCVDSFTKLTSLLKALDQKDPMWAVCGNAGGNGYRNFIINMEDNGVMKTSKDLPAKVTSLDENLLIIKNDCNLCVSSDIKSFHFYGTDLCILADFLGYSAYVIDFMVRHLSSGNLGEMEAFQPTFVEKYGRKFRSRFIQTTCTKFALGDSPSKNKFINSPFIFFWIKAFERIKVRLF